MDNKIRDVLAAAVEKTERGGLEWQAFDDEAFRAAIGTGYIHIQRGSTELSSDGDKFYPHVKYSVQISDAKGRVVAEDEAIDGSEGYALFDRLFQASRKSALGTEHILDDMLRNLKSGARS